MLVNSLQFLGTNSVVLGIVSICGIVGFILTIIVTVRTSHISKIMRYNDITSAYNKQRRAFKSTFDGHRESIMQDGDKTDRLLKNILKTVEEYDSQFHDIMSLTEKITLWRFKSILKKDAEKVNFNVVCNFLATLSGRLSKKGDKKNG